MRIERTFDNGCGLTGGGKLIYRMTKPAVINEISRKMTIAHSQTGSRLQYVSEITNEPTNSLSAIGSKNEPNLLACDFQFLAINPSNCGNRELKNRSMDVLRMSIENLPNQLCRQQQSIQSPSGSDPER